MMHLKQKDNVVAIISTSYASILNHTENKNNLSIFVAQMLIACIRICCTSTKKPLKYDIVTLNRSVYNDTRV